MRPFNSRNLFDLSHEKKLTCSMGYLVPIMCEEILPGDKFKVNTDILVRLAPMLAPIMQNINVYTHYFFVPNRLLWDKWEDFITGGADGSDASVPPTIEITNATTSSLADYLGIPTGITNALAVSALPFRAYNLVYNEWYRDENLQEPVTISLASGADTTTNTTLLRRCWQRDYFTNALPFQQRGDAVRLPLGNSAPLKTYNVLETGEVGARSGNFVVQGGDNVLGLASKSSSSFDPADNFNEATPAYTNFGGHYWLGADLSDATAATINDIRQAFQVQRWLEKNARAGARYVETILSHFNVRSSDARLQRPEYLGGGKSPIMISEVLQSSADDNQPTPLATMAGHGVSAQRSHQFKKFFEEHGFVIGLLSIMPRSGYFQGLARMWNRATRYDYYWPVFSHLGEDAVYNRELFAQGTDDDSGVFGFQPRYQEYRRRYGTVHGDFRSSLKFWHLAREFESLPQLNAEFIECNPDTRIFAVQEGDHFWVELRNNISALRPIPVHGTPGFIDHD